MPKGFNYAVESLEIERKNYLEKIEALEDERDHFKKDLAGEIDACRERVRGLNGAIVKLGGRVAAGGGTGSRRGTRGGGNGKGTGKSPAKCGNGKSSWWCYMKCPKNKDRSCTVIKFRDRGKGRKS
jgi:hypothetical protein